MGHALNGSLQDVLVRWHRMRGFDTLWQPGYDHAGISTQNVVEKQLVAEGTSRQELGRDAFLERTWRWLDETGRTIMSQYRRLGASLDYARERFTMDEAYVASVMTFFVRLWEAGWIYRANRIVNWCPHHETAISDLEVEHAEVDDTLVVRAVPVRRRRRLDHDRDRAAGDDPRRRRRRGPSGRRALSRRDRPRGRRPGRRAARARDRRRARRARVRHGRAQGHARPRPDRLRDRARPRPRDADRDRAGRPAHGRGLRGRDAGGGRRADRRLARGARPAREARALPPLGGDVRALPLADRAARLAPVVVPDGRARAPGDRGAARAARPLPPREPAPLRDRVPRAGARLVRLAAALVGPPDPDLDVRRRAPDLRVAAAGGVRRVRLGRARARPRRARHLVQLRALAVRDARLARVDAGARALLPAATSASPRARSSGSGRTG